MDGRETSIAGFWQEKSFCEIFSKINIHDAIKKRREEVYLLIRCDTRRTEDVPHVDKIWHIDVKKGSK